MKVRDEERTLDRVEQRLHEGLRRHFDEAHEERPSRERIQSLLRAANVGAPWLRVVPKAAAAPEPLAPRRSWRLGYAALSAGAIAVGAIAIGVAWLDEAAAPAIVETPPRETPAVNPEVIPIHSELVLSSGVVTVDGLPSIVGRAPLSEGQRIATGKGRACISTEPAVDLCLDLNSELRIHSLLPGDVRFEVVRGSAVAKLSSLPAGQAVFLSAGHLEAKATATAFGLAHDPERSSARLTVLEGNVDVVLEQRRTEIVSAHRRLEFDSGSSRTVVQTISRVEASPLWTQLAMAHWWRPAEVGIAEVVAEDGATAASIDGAPSLPLPIRVLLPTGKHTVLTERDGKARRVDFEVQVGEPRRVVLESEEPTLPTARTKDTPSDFLERARELRRSGDSAAALVAYDALRRAHPASHEARTVLVTMGKLELELGRSSRALAHFDRYLETGGTLEPEALGGKIAALRALGRRVEERRTIERYLSHHPQGFLAPKLRERLDSMR